MIWENLGKHQEAARAAEGMIITRERGNMMDHVLLYFIKWNGQQVIHRASWCFMMFLWCFSHAGFRCLKSCQPFHSCTMLHSSHLISNVTKPPAMSRIFACLQSDWLWIVQAMAHWRQTSRWWCGQMRLELMAATWTSWMFSSLRTWNKRLEPRVFVICGGLYMSIQHNQTISKFIRIIIIQTNTK